MEGTTNSTTVNPGARNYQSNSDVLLNYMLCFDIYFPRLVTPDFIWQLTRLEINGSMISAVLWRVQPTQRLSIPAPEILTTAHRPVAACYMCHAQLRKCRDLMVRSLKADEVLTQVLLGGEAVNVELLASKTREVQKFYELTLTPHERITIEGAGPKPVKANIIEKALSIQCKEEIDAEVGRCLDHLTFEEDKQDIDDVELRDVESIDNDGILDRAEISEQSGNAVYTERDVLTVAEDVKQEKPEGMGTYVQRCIDYLKLEGSEDENDNERNEMTNEESTKHQERLLSPRKELMKIVSRRCRDYLKFGDSAPEEVSERVIQAEVENIKDEVSTDGRAIGDEELVTVDAESMENADAASAEKCKQTNTEEIQDRNTLTPGGNKKLRTRKTLIALDESVGKEAKSTNFGRYALRSTRTGNNRQISTNSSKYSSVNRFSLSVEGDNDSSNTNVKTSSCRAVRKDGIPSRLCNSGKYLVPSGKETDEKHVSQNVSTYADPALNKSEVIVTNDFPSTRVKKTGYLNSSQQITVFRKQKRNAWQCEICKLEFNFKCQLKKHFIVHTDEKPYECEICKVKLRCKKNLMTHLRIHTGEKPYECEICKVSFNYKCYIKKHLSIHTGEKRYQCDICKAKFCFKSNLKVHLKIHNGEKPYECEICKAKFTTRSSLKTHLIIHTGEKPYECDICNVKFKWKGYLKAHLRTHTGVKPYECEICKAKFAHKSNLTNHLKIHTSEKAYECDICKVRFAQKYGLQSHLSIHTNEKLYKCEICKVKFRHKANIKTHLRIHTGDKPYECQICKFRFSHKSHLNRHLNVHTGEKPHECGICKAKFAQKYNLKKHLRSHTGEKLYQCEICKVRFSENSHLKTHLRTHTGEKPYECEICKARFNRMRGLNTHQKFHTGEKFYECEICKLRFSEKSLLTTHFKNTHTGKKPYECGICKFKFARKDTLKNHSKTHLGK